MNIKRPLPDSLSNGHQREIFQSRNQFAELSDAPREISNSEKVSRSLASCFRSEEELAPLLCDEIPKETVSYIVGESRVLLAARTLTQAHWDALSEFLSDELGVLLDLKKQTNQAQLDCVDMLKVAEEVCDPASEAGPNRILEVALALQEAKMRRDNLRARVKLVTDELCTQILAGISQEDRDSLEIRLRGVLGQLS